LNEERTKVDAVNNPKMNIFSIGILEHLDCPADPSQGYFVDYQATAEAASDFGHYFCGPQEVGGALCPNCRKPLLRFLALDTCDSRLNLQGSPSETLSLLFCWTCNIAQERFLYRILADGVEFLRYGRGGVEADFPYEGYPIFFPGARATLRQMTAEEQHLIVLQQSNLETEADALARSEFARQRPDLSDVRHQVGGEPFLLQPFAAGECPDCGGEMPFLASIGNDCLDVRGLAGEDGVQVLFQYCRRCHIVGVYQETD